MSRDLVQFCFFSLLSLFCGFDSVFSLDFNQRFICISILNNMILKCLCDLETLGGCLHKLCAYSHCDSHSTVQYVSLIASNGTSGGCSWLANEIYFLTVTLPTAKRECRWNSNLISPFSGRYSEQRISRWIEQ